MASDKTSVTSRWNYSKNNTLSSVFENFQAHLDAGKFISGIFADIITPLMTLLLLWWLNHYRFKEIAKGWFKYRSNRWRCSVRKGVLRKFAKFKGKYLYQSLFFNEVAGLMKKGDIDRELWGGGKSWGSLCSPAPEGLEVPMIPTAFIGTYDNCIQSKCWFKRVLTYFLPEPFSHSFGLNLNVELFISLEGRDFTNPVFMTFRHSLLAPNTKDLINPCWSSLLISVMLYFLV